MRLLLVTASAVALAVSASAASAQDGWYGAVDLGWHSQQSGDWVSERGNPFGERARWEFETEDDWAAFARFGARIAPKWRFEVEGGYRVGDIDEIFGRTGGAFPQGLCATGTTGLTCPSATGDMHNYSLMANFIYDFSPESRFNPFVGFGVGASLVDIDVEGTLATSGGVGPAVQNVRIDDGDLTWAAQALAGFSYAVSERMNLDLTYRYFVGADHVLPVEYASVTGLDLGDFEGDYQDHSVTIGLRYAFGAPAPAAPPVEPAPPPPPPPPPAPPPPPPPPPAIEAREFVVYFPFDQYVLTPEAQTVVQEAASYALAGNAARVVVTGHADTSGSAAYNIRLSERRAKTVADALVGLGVNGGSLSVDWKGESQPAVATGDGVKEPLNRRATIDIAP